MVLFQALNAYFHLWPIVSHPTNLRINMQTRLASCIIVCQHIFKKQFLSLLINWLLLNVPSEFCQSVCLSCHQILKKALLIYPLRKRQLLSEGFFFVLAPSVTRDLIQTNFQSIHRKPTNSSTKKNNCNERIHIFRNKSYFLPCSLQFIWGFSPSPSKTKSCIYTQSLLIDFTYFISPKPCNIIRT